jgi:hypothetical protein
MLVSSDFLGYLNRKKEVEKKSTPLIQATLQAPAGDNEKNQPVDPVNIRPKAQKHKEDVEYLNERSSTVNVKI